MLSVLLSALSSSASEVFDILALYKSDYYYYYNNELNGPLMTSPICIISVDYSVGLVFVCLTSNVSVGLFISKYINDQANIKVSY